MNITEAAQKAFGPELAAIAPLSDAIGSGCHGLPPLAPNAGRNERHSYIQILTARGYTVKQIAQKLGAPVDDVAAVVSKLIGVHAGVRLCFNGKPVSMDKLRGNPKKWALVGTPTEPAIVPRKHAEGYTAISSCFIHGRRVRAYHEGELVAAIFDNVNLPQRLADRIWADLELTGHAPLAVLGGAALFIDGGSPVTQDEANMHALWRNIALTRFTGYSDELGRRDRLFIIKLMARHIQQQHAKAIKEGGEDE